MFEICYTSCNCNQTPHILDWGKNNLICYVSCNAVMIYDPKFGSGGKIIKTLVGHTKRVNSVRWLRGNDIKYETELISASADGSVAVWSRKENEYIQAILKGHDSIVTVVDGLYKGNDRQNTYLISASMDSTVRIWYRDNISGRCVCWSAYDQFSLIETISLGDGVCMAVKLAFLPTQRDLILACALDNSKIQIYVEDSNKSIGFIKSVLLVGHEDWVRGLDFKVDDRNDLILASSSQDSFIRLWRISPKKTSFNEGDNHYIDKMNILTKSMVYTATLDSVLAGHDDWIYSVNWSPNDNLQLLSASIDKTMLIWEFDPESGLWVEKVRVGEVGGNTIGFYGGVFSPDGRSILAHSYNGAFHLWTTKEDDAGMWIPEVTLGGHFNEVVDLAWEPKGEFLVSVSYDQTTRIHAPWKRDENSLITWHEIARPQVHGYDMSCLAMLSRYKFASGAEEKIVRIFEAPTNFIQNFIQICQKDNEEDKDLIKNLTSASFKGASVPSLQLSNKAVYTDDNIEDTQSMDKKNPYPEESHFKATDLKEPPTEEILLQNTLWPEVQKLYGHGYEVYSLATSPDGLFLASACKSTSLEHAAILLWNPSNWTQIQKLPSHTLTIAQMQFSPDSKHLLSVSRDRRWSLFTKNENENKFELVATTDKKTSIHTRIIWCCSWTHDSKFFVTGSRDGKVVVWTRNEDKVVDSVLGKYEAVGKPLELKKESVTAVAFGPIFISDMYIMAVGLESGCIHLYKWSCKEWQLVVILDNTAAHHLAVKRLAFRPILGRAGDTSIEQILQLASCSSDHSVKIFNINIDKL